MAPTPREQYEKEREKLRRLCGRGHGPVSEADCEAIEEFLDARDGQVVAVPSGDMKTTDSGHSLRSYCNTLRMTAERLDVELTEATADDINRFMDRLLSGADPNVADDGLSPRTVSSYQGILRKFYDYYAELGVEKTDIEIRSVKRTPVNEQDMFTRSEIDDLRGAIDNNRDRALFELLLNTGQRVTAIQTLRVKDIDLDEKAIYLNPEADGLKGADRAGTKRPMLGAWRACYDWMNDHPASDNPDAYFITHLPSWNRGGSGEMLTHQQIGRLLKAIGDRAGVDKPVNPHAFRHNFVTIAKRDYELDDTVIKRLTGHADGSKVMETTYAHLSMDDVAEKAEEGAGLREKSQNRLTPVVCPTCYEPLAEGERRCDGCGTVWALDEEQIKQIEESVTADTREAKEEAEDLEEYRALDRLEQLVSDNPELVDVLESLAEAEN